MGKKEGDRRMRNVEEKKGKEWEVQIKGEKEKGTDGSKTCIKKDGVVYGIHAGLEPFDSTW